MDSFQGFWIYIKPNVSAGCISVAEFETGDGENGHPWQSVGGLRNVKRRQDSHDDDDDDDTDYWLLLRHHFL